jgi:hypothetical protein
VGVCVVQVGFWRRDFDRACRWGREQYLKGISDSSRSGISRSDIGRIKKSNAPLQNYSQ